MVGRGGPSVLHGPPALAAALNRPDALLPDDLAHAEAGGVRADVAGDRITERAGAHDVQGATSTVVAGARPATPGADGGERGTDGSVELHRVRLKSALHR